MALYEEIKIKYKTLQSQEGIALVGNREVYFKRLDVEGNNLVLYKSDNGLTEKGRLGGIYNLNKYDVKFE